MNPFWIDVFLVFALLFRFDGCWSPSLMDINSELKGTKVKVDMLGWWWFGLHQRCSFRCYIRWSIKLKTMCYLLTQPLTMTEAAHTIKDHYGMPTMDHMKMRWGWQCSCELNMCACVGRLHGNKVWIKPKCITQFGFFWIDVGIVLAALEIIFLIMLRDGFNRCWVIFDRSAIPLARRFIELRCFPSNRIQ